MNGILPFLPIVLLLFNGGIQQKEISGGSAIHQYDSFILDFRSVGMGSNMGSMQATLRIRGTYCLYTYEQNSSRGFSEEKMKPDTLCSIRFRTGSIDSILDLVRDIEDTLIWVSNRNVMSGCIDNILIRHDSLKITFTLWNASHPVAEKIVEVLNSNLPPDKPRLGLFKLPPLPKE